jgi:thiol-disulfide isomerase/thioredoxin/outer membrane lipoprotein-sorting protein
MPEIRPDKNECPAIECWLYYPQLEQDTWMNKPNMERVMGPVALMALMILRIGSPVWAEPSTQPAATEPVTPTVASVLAGIDAAYGKLQSAEFDGKLIGHFDIAGQNQNQEIAFTSTFAAPNQFRHEVKDNILLGSTGSNVYSYLAGRNQYQSADAPKTRSASADWPASVTQILQSQNPSLLLAMSKSAGDELKQLSKSIKLESPAEIDGKSYDTLRFDTDDHQIITLLVDPMNHLLRKAKFDLKQPLIKAGTTGVNTAEVTIDYTHVVTDAPLANNLFAWTAPAGAVLATATAAIADGSDPAEGPKVLVGKEAPDFSLLGLDDKPIKLSALKGSVVVLDFWATWCGPCVASLPHLNQLYKDQSPNGLKVFAVNLKEDKDHVKEFVDKKGWSLPVLLDSDGNIASAYKADAIPETVVVGKDGKVKQIFVGGGHEEEIASLVAKELK